MSTLALNQLCHYAARRAGGASLSRFKKPFRIYKGSLTALIHTSVCSGTNCAFVACRPRSTFFARYAQLYGTGQFKDAKFT